MVTSYFAPVERPAAKGPNRTLDEEVAARGPEAALTLYYIDMVVVSATDLSNKDFGFDRSDPYCEVAVGGVMDRTAVVDNDLSPVWNEPMTFFLPTTQPASMTLTVLDKNVHTQDGLLGRAVFEFRDSFADPTMSTRVDTELPLLRDDKAHGSLQLRVACRVLRPILTEIKLHHVATELACQVEEQEATVVALDVSEQMREEAVRQLTRQEQEIISKAQELEESQLEHHEQLSKKDHALLEQADLIESKIQQIEEADFALREADLYMQEAQHKLTEAEEEILRQGQELEEKQRLNDEALTKKEREMIATSQQLEQQNLQHEIIQKELQQTAALKLEIENELTSKEKIMLELGRQLEARGEAHLDQLSHLEQDFLQVSRTLAEKEAAAQEAQNLQDEREFELNELRSSNEAMQQEVHDLSEDLDESEKLRQEVIERLTVQEQRLLDKAQELEESHHAHQGELTAKDEVLLARAELLEAKVQEMEQTRIALKEADLKRQEAESRLTQAEKDIVKKGEELERKFRHDNKALFTAKEKEMMSAASELEEKVRQSDEVRKRLEQVVALKQEVENELTSKEKIILEQGRRLELRTQQHSAELTKKEQELSAVSQTLAHKDALAQEAQRVQDKKELELRQFNEGLSREVRTLSDNIAKVGNASRDAQQELDALRVRNKALEEKNKILASDLEATKLLLEKEVDVNLQKKSTCGFLMGSR